MNCYYALDHNGNVEAAAAFVPGDDESRLDAIVFLAAAREPEAIRRWDGTALTIGKPLPERAETK